MTEKYLCVNELVKYDYSEIGEYIDENHTDKPLRNDEIVKLLNELSKENKELKTKVESMSKELCNCEEDYIYEEW